MLSRSRAMIKSILSRVPRFVGARSPTRRGCCQAAPIAMARILGAKAALHLIATPRMVALRMRWPYALYLALTG